MINAFVSGITIGPPLAKEYAVEPVGVDIIKPSGSSKHHFLIQKVPVEKFYYKK